MSIRWDQRNKRWRFEFDRYVQGRRYRLSRLLPSGWSQAQADAFDRHESGRLYAIATGVQRQEHLIDEAVAVYLQDKKHLKSYKATAEHLAAIAWAYSGKPLADLPGVSQEVIRVESERGIAPATIKNRLAGLKAACRWAWKRHGMCDTDPTVRMHLPQVSNERHTYIGRAEMLRACRACTNWRAQIAIRVAFYTGMRLGELMRVKPDGDILILHRDDTKNGHARAVPVHPKIAHLTQFLPLPGPKITIQRAWERARKAAGLEGVTFHDLRHSAASEMVNGGIDLYVVGKVLGHRDQRSTQRYAHLTADALKGAVSKIGRRA